MRDVADRLSGEILVGAAIYECTIKCFSKRQHIACWCVEYNREKGMLVTQGAIYFFALLPINLKSSVI